MENKDNILLLELESAITVFAHKNNITYKHIKLEHQTESLYRFGLFDLDGNIYSISAWHFKDNIVTFEHETSHKKIKFSIDQKNMLTVFEKETLFKKNVRYLRNTLSNLLKDLSDKLHT